MPGQDGTGPMGQGAMTGRGLGVCNSNTQTTAYGRGCGMGLGRRRGGSGFGRGQGRGFGLNANTIAQPQQDELSTLKNQANLLKNSLDNVNNRISELEEKE